VVRSPAGTPRRGRAGRADVGARGALRHGLLLPMGGVPPAGRRSLRRPPVDEAVHPRRGRTRPSGRVPPGLDLGLARRGLHIPRSASRCHGVAAGPARGADRRSGDRHRRRQRPRVGRRAGPRLRLPPVVVLHRWVTVPTPGRTSTSCVTWPVDSSGSEAGARQPEREAQPTSAPPSTTTASHPSSSSFPARI
jgi:hypothetical protein